MGIHLRLQEQNREKEYLFKCISSDGTTQLQTVTGKTEAGNVGIAYGQTLDEKQKALSEKLKEKIR